MPGSNLIAIIDSGSTKADWRITDGKQTIELTSQGMNPCSIGEDEVIAIINSVKSQNESFDHIKKIYFYGAGCSGIEQQKVISDSFKKIFTDSEIIVQSDLIGAVIATCGNAAGVVCIIGTGSNALYYDGKTIHPNNYGLGFILADEGAGTYLGKKLITNFLYGNLPAPLTEKFQNQYNLTRDDVIKKTYNNPTANTWLASFAPFLIANKEDAWVHEIVKNGFNEFINLYVIKLQDKRSIPVHFTGSIAYHFKEILNDALLENNISSGKIIQKPIKELLLYHLIPANS